MQIGRVVVALGAMAVVAGCGSVARTKVGDPGAAHWRALAEADIRAAKAVLLETHPGTIESYDPGFREWLEAGSEKALTYVPRVQSYDDMLSVVRFYAVGFHDGHLAYSDDTRPSSDIVVDGWHVFARGDSVVVDAVAPDWPAPLPPIGSEFVGCDGQRASQLLETYIAPFTHAAIGPGGRQELWDRLTTGPLIDSRWHSCRFATSDGRMLDLPQSWSAAAWDTFMRLVYSSRPQPASRVNSVEALPDRTLWIRAGNFQLSDAQNVDLEHMIEALREGPTPSRIVFDARGNGGGDSGIGYRIFMAATGGIDMEDNDLGRFPVTSAWWRVSDTAVASLARRESMLVERGSDSATLQAVRRLRSDMTLAREHGEPWVHQAGSDTPRLTRADMQALHAHLRRPVETVALLTDGNCASACLDFADLVRSVPGSIHIGSETSADTVYIDVGSATLPSGNSLMLPLKVWRNRLRGNNETLTPDVALLLDPDPEHEQAIRQAVLDVLGRSRASKANR